jgi:hypothetical protein
MKSRVPPISKVARPGRMEVHLDPDPLRKCVPGRSSL